MRVDGWMDVFSMTCYGGWLWVLRGWVDGMDPFFVCVRMLPMHCGLWSIHTGRNGCRTPVFCLSIGF